jgi:serine protease AprX
MRNSLLSIFFLVIFQSAFSQNSPNTYWIVFKDKNNSPYSISNPSAYLSERAIARREKQHIGITEKDLPVNPHYISMVVKNNATLKSTSKWLNAISVSLKDESLVGQIQQLPFILSIQKIEVKAVPSGISKFDIEATSEPVTQRSSSSMTNSNSYNYGLSYAQAHQIGADCMHEKGYNGKGMVIAQLDAGYFNANTLAAFDSLRLNNQILGCRDFVTGDTLVFEDHSHGMNVLSCMGGNLPGKIIGTAPKAEYWLLRTEEAATETIQEEINWVVGAEFADSVGADIINSSLGYSTFDNPADNHTYADMDGNTTIITKAADIASSVGIFVCSSAGNSGGSPWFKITAPADADSILTVGAVDSTGVIAGFSSRGLTYDGRIKPNTVAQGVRATIAANFGGVAVANGTSFSSPITAGAVACLWQANPTKTNMEILQAIQQSASQAGAPDSIKGYGVPDFCFANRILSGIPIYEDESFSVYPNPFNSNFQLAFYSPKKQTILIDLYDISGKRIYSESKVVDVYSDNRFILTGADNLAVGVYMLRIKTEEKTYHEKIVKQ